VEARTQQFALAFEAAEVALTDRACRLDFDAGVVRAVLHHDVN